MTKKPPIEKRKFNGREDREAKRPESSEPDGEKLVPQLILNSRNLTRHNYLHLNLQDFIKRLKTDFKVTLKIEEDDIRETFMEVLLREAAENPKSVKDALITLKFCIEDPKEDYLFTDIAETVINDFLLEEENGECYFDFLFKEFPSFLSLIKYVDEEKQERIRNYFYSEAKKDNIEPVVNCYVRGGCNIFENEVFYAHDVLVAGMSHEEAELYLSNSLKEFKSKGITEFTAKSLVNKLQESHSY